MNSRSPVDVSIILESQPVTHADEARLVNILAECWKVLSGCINSEPQLIRSNLLLAYDGSGEASA